VRTVAIATAVVALVSVHGVAYAQSGAAVPARPVSGLGYGFGGVGAATFEGNSTGTWHVGGGGEAIFRDAVGVGAEIGYLGLFEESEGVGIFSVNGTYHFNGGRAPARRVRPFVTGGYSLGFEGDDHVNLVNVGGGLDYWLKPKIGLRIEVRDHVWSEGGETLQLWGVRVGVTLR
jgi:hypothetical protein